VESDGLTLQRGIDLLDQLRLAGQPLGTRELARRAGLSPSATSRLLAALASRGMVRQEVGGYALGWRILEFATALLQGLSVVELAAPLITDLRDTCGETVTMQRLDGFEHVCVYEALGTHELTRRVGVGRRTPLLVGASGRCILAFMSPADQEATIAHGVADVTGSTALSAGDLRARLEETQQTFLARSHEETTTGVAAIATPVFGEGNTIVGSVVISGAATRMGGDVLESFEKPLLEAGRQLSMRLGANLITLDSRTEARAAGLHGA
jgi:DNA-binding IclR family transcriptional regulator